MERHVAGGVTRGGRAPIGSGRKLGYGREISEKRRGIIVIPGYQGVMTTIYGRFNVPPQFIVPRPPEPEHVPPTFVPPTLPNVYIY